MDNPEEVLHSLEEFTKIKPKDIPRELDDYLCYVAKTGDPVFKWSIIKCLFREKLLKVITDFYESTLTIDLPQCPNVDPFNYERMKAGLLEKLDSFHGAPFTVQRISELLTNPRKEYNRADKFMRAIEKNILVVSTREPGRYSESDSENPQDAPFNGIPEPNETPMESSFTCNDLTADPDSSSQTYEVVNSESQVSTFNSKVDTDNLTQFSGSIKSDEGTTEMICEETSSTESESGKTVNIAEEVVKEVNLSEKECESVICSTVPLQPEGICLENENSNDETSLRANEAESDISKEEVSEGIENNIEVMVEKSEETDAINECKSETSEENSCDIEGEAAISSQSEPHEVNEVENFSRSDSESENVSDVKVDSPSDCTVELKAEASVEPDTQVTLGEEIVDRPVSAECDTSNSCDSELELKLEVDPSASIQTEPVTSDNEVTSCVYLSEEKSVDEPTEQCTREASVIHATITAEPESMEVDECQTTSTEETQQ